ncbi:hypothetical protein ACMD2_12040 [Ananas comosus]|uniref:SWIM-type domain-containing protein n=1 Tax=Ananas comosus TaxID=4615 RepID=A0A199UVR8_ANACO|nr:hypothetical protein ACMD2_12040 [Ananas comosus]
MEKVNCSCKFFEFSGLICSHTLKVMLHSRMHKIPSHYIIKCELKMQKTDPQALIFKKINKLVDENIKLSESLKEKQDQSENIVEHHTATIFSQASSVGFVKLKNPLQFQCKGKRKPQRYKPPVKKAVKKARTCQHCKKKWHNIRTCRELLESKRLFHLNSSERLKSCRGVIEREDTRQQLTFYKCGYSCRSNERLSEKSKGYFSQVRVLLQIKLILQIEREIKRPRRGEGGSEAREREDGPRTREREGGEE